MKKVLLVTAVVLILILVLAVLTPFVVDLNRYKGTILAQLKPYVPRGVDFDHVELTLLTGVGAEIRGLRVSENPLFGDGDFLRVKRLKVGLRLLPLLAREIKIRRVTLNEPVVQLIRNADGRSNFSDLAGSGKGPEGTAAPVPVTDALPGAADGPGVLAGLLLNDLEIRNATVSYRDETLFPQAPPLVVHDLDVSAKDLSLSTPVTVRIDAGLFASQGQNLHLSGVVGPVGDSVQAETVPVRLSCKLGPLSWESLPPLLREHVMKGSAYRLSSASLRADLEADGTLREGIRTRSEWRVSDVAVRKTPEQGPAASEGSPEITLEGPAEVQVQTEGTQQALRVNAHAEMGPLRIQVGDGFRKPAGVPFSVTLKGSREGNRWNMQDLRLELYQLDLNGSGEAVIGEPTRFDLRAQSAPVGVKGWGSLVPAVSEYDPDGSLLIKISARGTPEDAAVDLKISSDQIGFRMPGKPGASPASEGGAGRLASLTLEAQARRRGGQVQGSGTMNIGGGEVRAVPFERFLSRAAFSGDRVDLSDLEVSVFSGTVRGAGGYGTKTGDWSFRPELKDIALEEVLDKLTEYKNVFSGRLSGTFVAEGRAVAGGKTAPVVTGSFRVAPGELKNFSLVGDVLQALLKLQDVAQFLGGLKGEVSEHASTRFATLDGTFRFQEEKLTLDPLHFHDLATSRSTDSDAVFSGSVALDTDRLDLKGKVILSPKDSARLAVQAEVLRALLDAEGRMVFPVTIQGRIQKPVPFLDTQYVAGAIARYYARKGLEQGLGALQKQLGGKPGGGTEPGQKPLDDLLRQLLK
jgi:AsmA protein